MYTLTVSMLLSLCLSAVAKTDDAEFESWMAGMRDEKCFGDLGCFDLGPPWFTWTRPVPVLPQSPEFIDTKFYLLNRQNPLVPRRLQTRPLIDFSSARFNKESKVFFIVHGFIGHYTDEWVVDIARQLIQLLDGNIILVDWANGSNMINYIQAVANARLVGREISRLVKALQLRNITTPCKTHGIGYSLGAQVLAYAANTSNGVHRITALDPAQPGFEGGDVMVRLDEDDAPFIDVIHTNGIPFLPDLGFGTTINVGHVDFFLNGGEIQPECRGRGFTSPKLDKRKVYQRVNQYLKNYHRLNVRVDNIHQLMEHAQQEGNLDAVGLFPPFSLLDFLKGMAMDIFEYVSCSHEKAPKYFLESLKSRNCSFWGVPWSPHTSPAAVDNCSHTVCSQMGLYSILYPARGNFYVATNNQAPYCNSSEGVDFRMKSGLLNQFLSQTEEIKCQRKSTLDQK